MYRETFVNSRPAAARSRAFHGFFAAQPLERGSNNYYITTRRI